jgi:hypothetical protein
VADALTTSPLVGVPITTSWLCPRDRVYSFEPAAIFMHPLAVLVITTPNPFERLDKAIGMLVDRAHNQLDAAIRRLESPHEGNAPQ